MATASTWGLDLPEGRTACVPHASGADSPSTGLKSSPPAGETGPRMEKSLDGFMSHWAVVNPLPLQGLGVRASG